MVVEELCGRQRVNAKCLAAACTIDIEGSNRREYAKSPNAADIFRHRHRSAADAASSLRLYDKS